MPIVSAAGAAIPNGVVFNNQQRQDAMTAIQNLQFADVWRDGPANPLSDTVRVRIDNQGNDANGRANLQAQLNGVFNAASTIAHVLVDASVGQTGGQAQAAQQLYAIRQIRGALQNSLTSGNTYTVTGTPQ